MRVEQQVLRLDVAVTDTLRVNVRQRAEELVNVEFDFERGHGGLHLVEVARCAVNRFGHVFEDKVEVDLFFLRGRRLDRAISKGVTQHKTHPFPI